MKEEKKLTLLDIMRILDRTLDPHSIEPEMKGRLKILIQDAANRIVRDLNFTLQFDPETHVIQRYIENRTKFVLGEMSKSNKEGLRGVLLEGYNNGESVQQIAERVDAYTGAKFNTSPEAIARTEIIGANNQAATESYRQGGFTKKRWLTSRDDKVRPAHIAAEGQVVNIDEPFVVGSSLLMFPGDKSPFPEDFINCRCTVLPEE